MDIGKCPGGSQGAPLRFVSALEPREGDFEAGRKDRQCEQQPCEHLLATCHVPGVGLELYLVSVSQSWGSGVSLCPVYRKPEAGLCPGLHS